MLNSYVGDYVITSVPKIASLENKSSACFLFRFVPRTTSPPLPVVPVEVAFEEELFVVLLDVLCLASTASLPR